MSSYSRPLPHAEYIRLKYASKSDDDRSNSSSKGVKSKSHRSKSHVKGKHTNIKIVDHDVGIRDMSTEQDNDDDDMAYAPREDKPTIAGIVDERPNHLIRRDLDRNRWRTLKQSHSDGSEETIADSGRGNSENKKRTESSGRKSVVLDNVRDRSRGSGDDSDLSPPRTTARPTKHHSQNPNDSENDLSLPRDRSRSVLSVPTERRSHQTNADDDLSPPRLTHGHQTSSYRHPDRGRSKGIESVRKDGRAETLSGKVAGLSDSKSVREEMRRLQEREAQLMQQLGDDALGRNAKTVYRDRGTGRVRDLEAEAAVSVKTDKEAEERAIRYKDWSGGLHQREERSQRLQQDLKEMDKPLSRYEDDEDRDQFLKEKELAEDPMLQFVRRKKLKKKMREAADKGELVLRKPVYTGPPPPPNRFAILPGFRWDGVDRSNGYEKQLMDKQTERIAVQEDAYKWSTEDM